MPGEGETAATKHSWCVKHVAAWCVATHTLPPPLIYYHQAVFGDVGTTHGPMDYVCAQGECEGVRGRHLPCSTSHVCTAVGHCPHPFSFPCGEMHFRFGPPGLTSVHEPTHEPPVLTAAPMPTGGRTPVPHAGLGGGTAGYACTALTWCACSMRTTQHSLTVHPPRSPSPRMFLGGGPVLMGGRGGLQQSLPAANLGGGKGWVHFAVPAQASCLLHASHLSLCPPHLTSPALRLFEGNLSSAMGNTGMMRPPQQPQQHQGGLFGGQRTAGMGGQAPQQQQQQQQGGLFGGQRTAGSGGKKTMGLGGGFGGQWGGFGGMGGSRGFGSGQLAGHMSPFS